MSEEIHNITSLPKKSLLSKKVLVVAGIAVVGVAGIVVANKLGLIPAEDVVSEVTDIAS